ncbi:MAG: hypothetical protein IKX89_01815 [Firmicutes bacterium]|nr:hypothetical protein [Bacillota bacterium]
MADKQKETKEKKRGSFASWFIEDEDEELLPEDGYQEQEAPEKAPKPSEKKSSKEKKKKKSKKDKAAEGEETGKKKKKHISFGLVLLILIVLAIAGLAVHMYLDIHSPDSENRGTVIGDYYCYYLEDKDQIVKYSTSRGAFIVENTDEDFPDLMAKLHPADRSASFGDYMDVVSAAMGDSFRASHYKFIAHASRHVLYSHPASDGENALWLYSEKTGEAKMVIKGNNIRGIDYGNNIIYTRDDDKNMTVCYRTSTSYTGQLISVEPFRYVSKSPVTFWTSTIMDFARGLIKGLKASTDSR